ncbi:DNA-directed RNA polymerase subunit L [Sulfuracidifex tepidarius]|uniref:DNA-directed RNA polymerase subunit Rpo11 n=1 Tax=Sulfuracidifex tepidarius TaxID=1294262 RepID=A0A510DVM6_9CREN|nr:DNA-directed RNA polymerase subunit L [Sulfuracidifex tepidarius]BBG24237.1 DNA-directed RNA polymerase subunit L [Sulfuracidifex tepidarius]BBG26994.1 DNA-directed RNA polymerase subunit L [Sulfuracidifex tepidarius]
MDVRLLKKNDNYMELEIQGEEHTLGNLIAGMLQRVKGVTFASYYKPHPLVDKIIIKIMTDGSLTPIEALKEAIKIGKEYSEQYLKEIKSLS